MRSKLSAAVVALAATAVLLTLAAAPASARLVSFSAPGHNVGCAMTGRWVRCDIRSHRWSPPRKPRSCELDWGSALAVDRSGRAAFVCAGDTTVNPRGRVLRYGRSERVGRFTCTSRRSGMTCSHGGSGHGFKLSRARYSTF